MINKNTLKFMLALKVRRMRGRLNISLQELGKLSGLSPSYLNEIEKGKKYPKIEKLISLAKALKIPIDRLTSAKLNKNLQPLFKLLDEGVMAQLPLDIFGISEREIFNLMSHSPEQFSIFLTTVFGMSKSFDLKIPDLQKAALRTYQEAHQNYFKDLELAATKARGIYLSKHQKNGPDYLKKILQKEFNYIIDHTRLTRDENTRSVSSLVVADKKNGKMIFFINDRLGQKQKDYLYAREIGINILKLPLGTHCEAPNFQTLLNDYRASYFAGAFLIDELTLAKKLKAFFKEKTINKKSFQKLHDAFSVSSEVFMHRLTQILPKHFRFNQLFFLRCNEDYENSPYNYTISKELHLGQLHHPHGVHLHEHYCGRWVTAKLLQEMKTLTLKKGNKNKNLFGMQNSHMTDNTGNYFCLSIAKKSHTKDSTHSCLTIGLLIDQNFKENVNFWPNSPIPAENVGQTCERCQETDCFQRKSPAIISQKEISQKKEISAIKEIISEI